MLARSRQAAGAVARKESNEECLSSEANNTTNLNIGEDPTPAGFSMEAVAESSPQSAAAVMLV